MGRCPDEIPQAAHVDPSGRMFFRSYRNIPTGKMVPTLNEGFANGVMPLIMVTAVVASPRWSPAPTPSP